MTTIATRAEAGEDAAVSLRELQLLTQHPVAIDDFNQLLAINAPEAHLAAAMLLMPEGMASELLSDAIDLAGKIGWRDGEYTKALVSALIAAIARSLNDGSE